MTICAACGAENAPGRKFCGDCGVPLSRACPSCGSANEAGVRFCGECGSALDADQAPPQRAAPAAERRLVSVLFADLVGFTTLSEGRDPEEVRELLSRYFDVARTLVGRYGGTIEKFIGDAVMAVWGTPVAREDDAERAVRAALELVAAVAALGEETGAGIRARAGVVTGEAAVTLGAEGQGMVAGDLVNTAARVQSAAEPATVLVTDATRRASSAAIAYEDAGSHELKGKAEPLQLHRAREVTAARGGALRSTQLEPPFVGRDREFRLVKELYHGCADDGTSRLLSVVGIAGIGKSRLAWEFEKYLDGLADDVWWHRGRCLAYGDGVAYWALAEMVRMRARIAEEEPADVAVEKLRVVLADAVSDDGERAWVEPRLAHLLALGEPQSFDRSDLFAAWRLFFERLSDRAPVVLVFEDLQWADASLLDFVEHLLDWSRSHPIFVLALTRPELGERRPGWGTGGRSSTTLSLDPLSGQAMSELLRRFVPGLPEEVAAQILDRSQGVPLYAVETVRMLLDRGLLAPDGDGFAVTGEIGQLEVPETLHALIAARIDDLTPDERAVVQDGSVLGKTFTLAGLTALSGRTPDELEPLLRQLVRKEVLSVEADPRSPERGQYGFLQDLLQRVAYETLSRADRRSRHLAAARHLETVLDAEAADVVAAHYLDAYAAEPGAADADEVRARAADALVRAARRAGSLGAHQEAGRAFSRAADLVDDPADRAELMFAAGDAAFSGAQWQQVRERLEAAIALFDEAGLSHRAARAAALLGWSMWFGGDLAGGAERIERALEVLADEEPDADLAAIIEAYARLRYFLGDYETAAERVERALEIADALVVPDVLVDALNTKNLVLQARGRAEESLALLERAVAIGREQPPTRAYTRALYNLSYHMQSRDQYEDSLAVDREGVEVSRRRGERAEEQMVNGHSAFSLMVLGRWDEAFELVAEIDVASSMRAGSDRSPRVWILLQRGEVEAARREWDEIAAHIDDAELQMRSSRHYLESQVLLHEGRVTEALAEARQAVTTAVDGIFTFSHPLLKIAFMSVLECAFAAGDRAAVEEALAIAAAAPPVEHRPFVAGTEAVARGRLALLDGDRAEAERELREAARLFGSVGARFERARALYYLGGADELAEARAVFEELGARPWVDRVDAAARPVSVQATP